MPGYEESLRRNCNPACPATTMRKRDCGEFFKRDHCSRMNREWSRVAWRNRCYCDDSLAGILESHALLVLPGQQFVLPNDVDCRAKDECSAQRRLKSHRLSWFKESPLAPPITIIAPAHNEEKSIRVAVRNLLDLDYPQLEVIVVNDGSEDRTLDEMR